MYAVAATMYRMLINAYMAIGMKDDGIIDTIVPNFQVTKEYVKSLFEAKPA